MSWKRRSALRFIIGMIGGLSIGLFSICLLVNEGMDDVMYDDGLGVVGTNFQRKLSNMPDRPEDGLLQQKVSHIRILCWIYIKNSTFKFNFKRKASFRKWGAKCDKFLTFIPKHNQSLDALGLDKISEDVKPSTSLIITIYRYIYKNHFHDFDWFLSAEEFPYFIMENLRHFLSDKDPDVPAYYGHTMKMLQHIPDFRFADRCAGTVLSRAGFNLLGSKGTEHLVCDESPFQLGIQFSQCLQQLGVTFGDSRDEEGRSRFLIFVMKLTLAAPSNWTFEYRTDDEIIHQGKGLSRISPSLISIGRSVPMMNSGYDFYIYDLIRVDHHR